MRISTSILFLIIAALSSCQSNKEYTDILDKFLYSQNTKRIYPHYYVLIPETGCPSCIYRAKQFCKSYWEYENHYTFIFTRFDSRKKLKYEFDSLLSNDNLILDTQNTLYNSGFNGMYPIIVESLEKEVKLIYATPNNYEIWNNISLLRFQE